MNKITIMEDFMILDILQVILPFTVLIIGIIGFIRSIKKHDRLLLLKELTIICLSLTILSMAIRAIL